MPWNFILTEIHKIAYEFAEMKMHLTAWNYTTVRSTIISVSFSLCPFVCYLESIAEFPSEILKCCFASLSDLSNSRVTLFKVSWVAIVVFLMQRLQIQWIYLSKCSKTSESISEITMLIILRITLMQLQHLSYDFLSRFQKTNCKQVHK